MSKRRVGATSGSDFVFSLDGQSVSARPDDTVASTLAAHGIHMISRRKDGLPSGLFCGMGSCFDCVLTVDGRGCVRACVAPARPDTHVTRGSGYLTPQAPRAETGAEGMRGVAGEGAAPMIQADVAIVGAGPAGLAAADEAALAGLSVALIDEGVFPGGQYLRPRHPASRAASAASRRVAAMRSRMLAALEGAHVRTLSHATVWGAFPDRHLAIEWDGHIGVVAFRALVIAPGAYERAIPFPGWTLPGVMTAGAAQNLVKSSGVQPGERILIAGSGPFLYAVAHELISAGCTVHSLLQAHQPAVVARVLPHLWSHWDDLGDAWRYWRSLRTSGVPIRFGCTVVEVRGSDRVEAAVVAQLDQNWKPIPGTEAVVECDAVCIGFGFQPAFELPLLLGCEMRHDGVRGGWVPVTDEDGRTSLPAVYVAGEVAGVGGGAAAVAEGHIAGLAVSATLGAVSRDMATRRASPHRRARQRARAFTDSVLRIFRVRPGLVRSIPDATIVCRCESVTAGEVRAAARDWFPDLRTVKGISRAGMGLCQGRTCLANVAELISEHSDGFPDPMGPPSIRPPLRPMSLSVLATRTAGPPTRGTAREESFAD